MSDANGTSKVTIGMVLDRAVRYWPFILAVVFLIGAGVEARIEIANLNKRLDITDDLRAEDKLMREILNSHAREWVNHDDRISAMEVHFEPENIQKWGAVQAAVDRHEDAIKELQRRAGLR